MRELNENNIFIDTNILIGNYAHRTDDVRCIKHLFSLTGKRLYVSSLSVAQLVSVFQKSKSNSQIKEIVRHIIAKFKILSFDLKDIENSLSYDYVDMEDTIQYIISKKYNCLYFVTNNIKDYNKFVGIKAISAKHINIIEKD